MNLVTSETLRAAAAGGVDWTELRKAYVIAALETHNGDRNRAADAIGLSRGHIYNLIRDMRAEGYEIPPAAAEPRESKGEKLNVHA